MSAAPGQHEHAAEQRRHGDVQRHAVRVGAHVAEDQDGGQHRPGQRGAARRHQEDLEADQSQAARPSRPTSWQ